MSKYVMGIDAGTRGVKCLIFDLKGILYASTYKEWSYDSAPENPLAKEFQPSTFWESICEVTREAIQQGGINSEDIIAVSAAGQREGMVLLDKEGKEIYAGPNIDLRALGEGIAIDSEFGQRIYSLTGHLPSFLFAPAKLQWLKSNRPNVYSAISTLLAISDWVIYKLSGERVSEVSSACELGLVNLHSRQWSVELVDLLKLPSAIYPPLVKAGTKIGKVVPSAAEMTGLSTNTQVVLGGPDTQSGLVGMGVNGDGEVGIVAGWSAPVQMVIPYPYWDEKGRIWSSCHMLPLRWILESNLGETGGTLNWLKEVTRLDYDEMDYQAQQVTPGAEGVLAFLGQDIMDITRLRLKKGGFIFPTPLSLWNIKEGHLIRAAIEGLCFALKANIAQLAEVFKAQPKGVMVGGGLIKSHCFTRLLADIIAMPIKISPLAEVTGLGVAMCASVGAGIYSNLSEAIDAMLPQQKVITPHPDTAYKYEEIYQGWLSTFKQLEEL